MILLIDAFYGNVINVHEKTETKVLRIYRAYDRIKIKIPVLSQVLFKTNTNTSTLEKY